MDTCLFIQVPIMFVSARRRRTELEGTSELGDELEGTSEPAENDLSKERTEQR